MSYGPTPNFGYNYIVKVGSVSMAAIVAGLRKIGQHYERPGMRGSRSRYVADVAEDGYLVQGRLVFQPDEAELYAMVQYGMGSGGVLAATVPEFTVIQNNGVKTQTFSGVQCNQWILRGRPGPVDLEMDCIGKTAEDTGDAGTPESTAPLVYSQCILTLADVARDVDEFTLTINNALVAKRYMGETVQLLYPGDRIVTLEVQLDHHANNADIYAMALEGVEGTLALSDGSHTDTFTFDKLQVPQEDPENSGRGEVPYRLSLTARSDGSGGSGQGSEVTFARS